MFTAVQPALQASLLRAWTKRGPFALFFWPVSCVFGTLVRLRRCLYEWDLLKTQHVDALVIVVGNVITGGAGKTPTVMAMVGHLQSLGMQVGVISRGYGRIDEACIEVTRQSDPEDVGDEPLLVHRTTQAPVFVARTRIEAANALLARYPSTQIIICDDGLQHYALYRDIEICVFDDRGCGNGMLLPAGPLREPWPRKAVHRVGQSDDRLLLLHTGTSPAFSGYTAQRKLASHAIRQDGKRVYLSELCAPNALPIVAVAGIGQPETFFAMLRALQLKLKLTIALPDHYDFDSFSRTVYEGCSLICTEKDAAKLWKKVPGALAVPLTLDIDPNFIQALDACVSERLAAKLSLHDGYKIT
jgi:tetraacyldisaccharide 4'-kinase